jgi:hypothetical protein
MTAQPPQGDQPRRTLAGEVVSDCMPIPLPGTWVDLLTEGVDLQRDGVKAVTRAVLQIMCSARRLHWQYADLYPLLVDTRRYELARQFGTGRGGRKMPTTNRNRLLQQLWEKADEVVAKTPPMGLDDAKAAIDYIRKELQAARDLSAQDRGVVGAVLDLAEKNHTIRPAAPARKVSEATGISRATAHRALTRLSADGTWLSLAKRGTRNRFDRDSGEIIPGKSSLYRIAPALVREHQASGEHTRGTTSPKSHDTTKSQTNKSHAGGLVPTSSVRYEVTAAEDEAVVKVLEAIRAAEAVAMPQFRVVEQVGNVVDLDSHRKPA